MVPECLGVIFAFFFHGDIASNTKEMFADKICTLLVLFYASADCHMFSYVVDKNKRWLIFSRISRRNVESLTWS